MTVYIDLVIFLNFLVDLLLILGVNRLTGHPANLGRSSIASALGGLYSGVCLLPGFQFVGNCFWRIAALAGISAAAFGLDRSTVRRGSLFIILSMSMGGITLALNGGGFWGILCGAFLVMLLCVFGLRGRMTAHTYVPVELEWRGKRQKLTALADTGNVLTDPVTGQQVVIVSCEIAREMTGLSREQLMNPAQTLLKCPIPGMRLIPYRTVGQSGGMLLAMKMDKVTVKGRLENKLVALAPERIGEEDGYQALTGG